ncbi:MgtC/SapB family protein [Daejeonella sp. JGW-45]|uniref:MgtC/SapB family protein n=1 Tax=Daejeonella sp. JGW-45 TaxID=3034148 RepID=UPI0023ECDCE1|nr:MgtC/SapB family protein [Daejeonella sp. JGW-45]
MNERLLDTSTISPDQLTGLAISLGIGFLIGLEREFSKQVKEGEEQFAGVRTFSMVAMLGFLTAVLAAHFGEWLFGVALFCLFAFVIVSYFQISGGRGNKGGTSEIALIITFVLGAVVFLKFILFALIVMVVMMLLLAFKPSLHWFASKLNRNELLAIILFVVMSALVIPFLPDDDFGPYRLWNLREIWKMVVLVSGTSLLGYMIAKILGNKGTLLAGIVGGLVSSTSVALAFSRKSRETGSGASSFYYAMGIISACTIMFPRILFEVYVINSQLARELWLPVTVISLAGFGAAFLIYRFKKVKTGKTDLPLKNPLDLGTAVKFALLYALIQWLVMYSGEQFGDKGTYLAGAVSGITDVDAITLSMAKMGTAQESSRLAINTILIAAMSNTLVKFILVIALGSTELRKIAFGGFAAIFLSGAGYLVYSFLAG